MSHFALTPIEQHQLALLHAHLQAGGGLIAPFAKEVFLIETHVAGTSHVPIREIEANLATGTVLIGMQNSSGIWFPGRCPRLSNVAPLGLKIWFDCYVPSTSLI